MKKSTVLIVVLTVLAVGGVGTWNYLRDNRLPAFEGSCHLYVWPQTTVDEVTECLQANASPKWPGRLHRVFRKHSVDKYIKPGHYLVDSTCTAAYVARMLNNGWQTPVRMTLSGTMRRRSDIASKVSACMMTDSLQMMAALCDRHLLDSLGFDTLSVLSLFIPDTYEMYWTDSPEKILARQKKEYDAFWTGSNLEKARALGLDRMEVSVLASIVSGETNYCPEMPQVAGVYLNRLRIGMRLQADPTIAYCYDYKVNRILKCMLDVDSPYNTYKYKGLPPSAICVPSRQALEAVLNPDRGGGNLYFCADPSFNGRHRFAKTYSEHRANAKAFQRALNTKLNSSK